MEQWKEFIPEQYRDQLFLTKDDVQNILRLGNNKTYEFLQDPPFRVERIGCQLRIAAVSFWKWYFAGMSEDAGKTV